MESDIELHCFVSDARVGIEPCIDHETALASNADITASISYLDLFRGIDPLMGDVSSTCAFSCR